MLFLIIAESPLNFKENFQMRTHVLVDKVGFTRKVVFIPNKFDDKSFEEASAVLGEDRMSAIRRVAEVKKWTQRRLESEVRCFADEVSSYPDRLSPEFILERFLSI